MRGPARRCGHAVFLRDMVDEVVLGDFGELSRGSTAAAIRTPDFQINFVQLVVVPSIPRATCIASDRQVDHHLMENHAGPALSAAL